MKTTPSVGEKSTNVRWRIIGWATLAAVVAYILRFNMSVAAPAMMRDLQLTEKQLGIVLGAFAWGYGLLQAPGGVFGQRVGPHKAMTWLFAGWFVTTALMAMVPHGLPAAAAVTVLVVLRAAQGAVQAPVFPITCGGTIASWLPPNRWALGNSLSTAGTTVGGALAGPGVTWLVMAIGWRPSFLVSAPLALILGVIWWRDYRDAPSTHRGVNAAELAVIGQPNAPADSRTSLRWMQMLTDRDLLCVTLSYFCTNYVFYLFFNWYFYYLTEVRRVDASLSGYFIGAQWVIGAITAIAGGIACDRLCVRFGATTGCRIAAIGGLLLSIPLLITGTLAQNATLSVALLSVCFGCIQFVDASYWSATMRIAGADAQSATGMMNTGGNIVGGIGAMLVPAIAGAFGWTVALTSGALFAVIGALLWLGIRADVPLQSRVSNLRQQ